MTPFSLPTSVTLSSAEYPVRTDFRVILEIFVMLDDPDLTDADKTEALLRMFYVDRPSDTAEAIRAFTAFVDPRSARKGENPSTRLIDWQQDFDLMAAPINHILSTECRALPYLHWRTFLSAYLEIPPESVFARVLRIREKLRTGKKLDKAERIWYKRNIDLVAMCSRLSAREEQILSDWTFSEKSPAKRVFSEEDEQRRERVFVMPDGDEMIRSL